MMNHNHVQGALMALDTVQQQMRFLVSIGYPRERIIASVIESFPTLTQQEADAAFDAAVAFNAAVEADLDRMERLEEIDLAVRAEHDLSQTMHEPEDDDG